MKPVFLFASLLVFISCSSKKEKVLLQPFPITVSGEFLFEGPNTLQGSSSVNLDSFANEVGINTDDIQSAYLTAATISFSPDSLRTTVESALVQYVSDNLPLVSVATKSPLPDRDTIPLEIKAEQDILPYLKDSSSTLVVDANITQDLDNLEASVTFEISIEY